MPPGLCALDRQSGCVLVTSGPGATNAVTGLTDALMDSIPLVCITGQVPTHLTAMTRSRNATLSASRRPCTKHNYLVRDVNGSRARDARGVP